MSFKQKTSTDGSMRRVDNVSGNTVDIIYPTNSTTGGRQKILTATYTVPQTENGTIYYLNATTEFVTTLPLPFLGAEYEFIVKAAPSGASYTVVTNGSANIIVGLQVDAAAAAGDTGTTDDTISFVDSQAVAGDRVVLRSDGTKWYAYATSKVAAGITFTTAS
jgi:hypothetical protein